MTFLSQQHPRTAHRWFRDTEDRHRAQPRAVTYSAQPAKDRSAPGQTGRRRSPKHGGQCCRYPGGGSLAFTLGVNTVGGHAELAEGPGVGLDEAMRVVDQWPRARCRSSPPLQRGLHQVVKSNAGLGRVTITAHRRDLGVSMVSLLVGPNLLQQPREDRRRLPPRLPLPAAPRRSGLARRAPGLGRDAGWCSILSLGGQGAWFGTVLCPRPRRRAFGQLPGQRSASAAESASLAAPSCVIAAAMAGTFWTRFSAVNPLAAVCNPANAVFTCSTLG